MADAEKPGGEGDAQPKKKSKLPLVLALIVVLAGGGAGAWYAGLLPVGQAEGKASAAVEDEDGETHEEDHGDGHGDKPGSAKDLGPMKSFEPFIANLADEGGRRYLKTTFQVEFFGKSVPPALEGRMPEVRDLVLTLLTSKGFDEIRTPEGKQILREQIITRVNQVLERDAVKAVYFTEFIVQ